MHSVEPAARLAGHVRALVLVSLLLASAGALEAPQAAARKTLAGQGIVVPKRPAIIAGLNQQFKSRQNGSAPGQPSLATKGLLAAAGAQLAGLVGRSPAAPGQKRAPPAHKQQAAGLYLDRHQQEMLAANPGLLNPAGGLLTRSDAAAPPSGPAEQLAPGHAHTDAQQRSSAPPQQSGAGGQQADSNQVQQQSLAGQQQLYRGHSLIELEVKSESDRRYVQELYANLSAALNEQAQRPGTSSVSPYVDIDFWSFKCALNDHIDIMVSPKSRAFIVGQLNRAKIKHRIKIDDIQTRLDAQQLGPAAGGQAGPAPAAGPSPGPPGSSGSSGSAELSGRHSAPGGEPAHGHASARQHEPSGRQHQQAGAGQPPPPAAGAADPLVAPGSAMNDSAFFDNYQRLADINQYLESIVARARDVARVQVIGRSFQGRYLRVLRLGYEQRDVDGSTSDLAVGAPEPGQPEPGDSHSSSFGQLPPAATNGSRILDQFLRRHQAVKKLGTIWLDGGTHAREWISPATVLYMAFRLADNHARCLKFFDYMQMAAHQTSPAASSASAAGRSAAPSAASLDADLLNGIHDINTSLLGGLAQRPRPRTEFEQKLELLAKRPQEVASEHACDLELEQLLRRYTFYIMPVLNPDGYEYSHTHNRLWRKTRSTSNHPIYRHFCLGADPNRNYDARHGSTGSSSHPCSQTYAGATPFTEPETRHQSNFVYAHRANMKMYISFHSYSQLILLPYSHSKQPTADHKDLESVGQAAAKAIERTHGTQYRVGPSASMLYTASGTASDWAYEKAGVKYSYTIELRDTGAYGFLLPRHQIIPTGEETFNGLLAMIGQMEKNDNLLTSKSMPARAANSSELAALPAPPADFVHAPDLDQLRPFSRFRLRPAHLENALDGSDTWATPQPPVPGVRDRRPAAPGADSSADLADKTAAAGAGSPEGPAANGAPDHRAEGELVMAPAEEPDAGYAFEGEGELMEPTNELDASSMGANALAMRAERAQLYGHIHAHSSSSADDSGQLFGRQSLGQRLGAGQQQQMPPAMGLSANGRNLINSPPQLSRTTPSSLRRESSQDLTEAS